MKAYENWIFMSNEIGKTGECKIIEILPVPPETASPLAVVLFTDGALNYVRVNRLKKLN